MFVGRLFDIASDVGWLFGIICQLSALQQLI